MLSNETLRSSSRSNNKYDDIRGPSDDEQYEAWALKIFNKFINKYPALKSASRDGGLRLLNVTLEEPDGARTKFSVEIRNARIREWYKSSFLIKPPDQRGSKTDSKLSPSEYKYWNTLHLDRLQGKVISQYVFSFSEHWEDAWLTNGAHRIILDKRWDDKVDDGGIHKIEFPYEMSYLDVEDNFKKKTKDLNGLLTLKMITTEVGRENWKNMNDQFHPVDLFWFKHKEEEQARIDHAMVFFFSNANLELINLIHSYYSQVNRLIRKLSDWNGYEQGTLDPSISRVFGDIDNSGMYANKNKKVYNDSHPYEFMLRALLIYSRGFVKNGEKSLDDFCKNETVTEEVFESFISQLKYCVDLFGKLRNTDGVKKARWPHKKLIELFTLTCMWRTWSKKQFCRIVVDEKTFLTDLDEVYKELLEESENRGNGHPTFFGARTRFANVEGLCKTISMVLSRLLDKGTIVLLDPVEQISTSDKTRTSSYSYITGQPLNSNETEYHHTFLFYKDGGVSKRPNVNPVEGVHNQAIENKKMSTSEYIEYMLNDEELVKEFTDSKYEHWQNGGINELIQEETNLDKYRYNPTFVKEVQLDKDGNDLTHGTRVMFDPKNKIVLGGK